MLKIKKTYVSYKNLWKNVRKKSNGCSNELFVLIEFFIAFFDKF